MDDAVNMVVETELDLEWNETLKKSFFTFIQLLIKRRYLIVSLAKREVINRYVGSLLGFIWTIINPLITILVFWVIFSVGFKVTPVKNVPFVVWLTAGMAAWFVFADIISGATNSIIENGQLIKKTVFPAAILPIVKIISCLVIHGVFVVILLGLIVTLKIPVSLYYLQFFYYLFCLLMLSLGLSWGLAALNVFIRDTSQIVEVVLQLGFWATPIFWNLEIMPTRLQKFFKLNPMFYIVQGYRDSFINGKPFWSYPYLTIYFWVVTLILLVAGALLFKKLRPQFAEAL